MKKMLACLMALVMLLSLCACAGEQGAGTTAAEQPTEPQDNRVALDVFAGLKVSFPASINGSGKKCNLDYDVSQVEYDRSNADIRAFLEGVTFYTDELSGLSNGDTVTVYASWSQSTADALGVKLQETSKEYTVSGLYDVYRSAQEVPAELDELDQVMEAMESAIRRAWTMQYEHYENCEESYRYYYAYSNDADGNAYISAVYVTAMVEFSYLAEDGFLDQNTVRFYGYQYLYQENWEIVMRAHAEIDDFGSRVAEDGSLIPMDSVVKTEEFFLN